MGLSLPNVTWIGVGAKYGGFLGGVGAETTTGWMINLGSFDRVIFNVESIKIGLGLGGGTGACLIVALNCLSPQALVTDTYEVQGNVDLGISLGNRWGGFARSAIRHLRPFMDMGPQAARMIIKGARNADDLRNLGHLLYNNYGLLTQGKSTPQLITIDIPVGGFAAELSITSSFQKFSIVEYIVAPPQ